MTTFPSFRVVIVIMTLVAGSAVPIVPMAPAGPAPDGVTAPRADAPKQAGDKSDLPPSSEELIAVALKAGTITYEESLRQRAFAIYGDPRVEPRFRSPIIDWEAGRPLFAEIDQKEATLSREVLADLAPFRARPNDPISIFNRPRSGKAGARQADEVGRIRRVATGAPTQSGCTFIKKIAEDWESELVPGTHVRAWIPKPWKSELGKYKAMVGKVWRAFPAYFTYPLPDNGNPCDETNPDSAVDVYFVIGSTVDPRMECRTSLFGPPCMTGSLEANGLAWPTKSGIPSRYSGYAMVDFDRIYTSSEGGVSDTIAHELAHISQFAYDAFESSWLHESTATWVAYKVTKALEKKPLSEYERLTHAPSRTLLPIFPNLHNSLTIDSLKYGAWLFFYSASIDLGDNIVKDVWERARRPGRDGIFAVDETIPLIEHFARYTVRNWNRDLTPQLWPYRNEIRDKTFPTDPKPKEPAAINVHFGGPTTEELAEPVPPLAARYYTFTFADSIRKVTFQNLLLDDPHAHVWAIQEIGGQWKEPEDWTKETDKVLCRDIAEENVTTLVLVMSNSRILDPLPPHPLPRVVADGVGCALVHGTAKATLHVKDDSQDVTYVSSRAHLRFKPRALPVDETARDNVAGNAEYDLLPTSVTWTAAGIVNDCTISGQILVTIPSFVNQPLDPARPAQGYLNVVGLTGGDFHSVMVSAFNPDPDVAFTKTCPGDPPQVTKYASPVHWLLHIPSQPNVYDGSTVVFKGQKSYDQGNLMDFLNLLPPGTQLPQIALDALRQTSSAPGIRLYTWEWELKPLPAASQTGGP